MSLLDNWQQELQKYIHPDQLPAMYGGNRYEPDAECSDYISSGGDVPPKYYLTNQTEASKDEMKRVLVGRKSTHKVSPNGVWNRDTIYEIISLCFV